MIVRTLRPADIPAVVELQREAFPPPFSEALLWKPEHLARHLAVAPALQFVAEVNGTLIGSCSNCILSENAWRTRSTWDGMVGGPFLERHDDLGTTLFGLDISIHPVHRRKGIGRQFYQTRFRAVQDLGLRRYGTASRLPDLQESNLDIKEYVQAVLAGDRVDRTLTPLLRYGLSCVASMENFMEDPESRDSAALLEWKP